MLYIAFIHSRQLLQRNIFTLSVIATHPLSGCLNHHSQCILCICLPYFREFFVQTSLISFNLGTMAYHLNHHPNIVVIIDTVQIINFNTSRLASQNNILPKACTNYRKQTIWFSAMNFWNHLPVHIQTARCQTSFKQLLKTHNSYYSLLHSGPFSTYRFWRYFFN